MQQVHMRSSATQWLVATVFTLLNACDAAPSGQTAPEGNPSPEAGRRRDLGVSNDRGVTDARVGGADGTSVPDAREATDVASPASDAAPNGEGGRTDGTTPGGDGATPPEDAAVVETDGAASDAAPLPVDECPDDATKTAPGLCGCGTPDLDGDADGAPDCLDGCPEDPLRTEPGCGCGAIEPDLDTDADGTPDCFDACPADPRKIEPGLCGCAVADRDTDRDGAPDCTDVCPRDADRAAAVGCGCGVAARDTDGDGDAVLDCFDACPADPQKSAPGTCGCGSPETDTDRDAAPDCADVCPLDPARIVAEGCGCGAEAEDVDRDADAILDCFDGCPLDPEKAEPGSCGCGVSDLDEDRDGYQTCDDACPLDPAQVAPGPCGCGYVEVESDGHRLCVFVPLHVGDNLSDLALDAEHGRYYTMGPYLSVTGFAAGDLVTLSGDAPHDRRLRSVRFGGGVREFVPDGDGGLFVVGSLLVGSESVRRPVVRLNPDGSENMAFRPDQPRGASGRAAAVVGDRLFVLGTFALDAQGSLVSGIVAFDRRSGARLEWSLEDPERRCDFLRFVPRVRMFAFGGDRLVVLGNEGDGCIIDTQTGRLDPWAADLRSEDGTRVTQNWWTIAGDYALVQGPFVTAEGEPRAGAAIYSIARRELTGDRTPAFVLDAPLPVRQVIEEDGVLYIQDGTSFFAAIDAESGTLISRYYEPFDVVENQMFAVRDGVVEALRWLPGGGFDSDTFVEVAHINLAAGSLMSEPLTRPLTGSSTSMSVVRSAGSIFVGGSDLVEAVHDRREGFAAFDASDGHTLESRLAPNWNPPPGRLVFRHPRPTAFARSDDALYLVGTGSFKVPDGDSDIFFDVYDYRTTSALSRADLSVLPWEPRINGKVTTLTATDEHVFLGVRPRYCSERESPLADCGFEQVNDEVRHRLAQVDARTGETTAWNPDKIPYRRESSSIAFDRIVPAGGEVLIQGQGFADQTTCITAVDVVSGVTRPWGPPLPDCAGNLWTRWRDSVVLTSGRAGFFRVTRHDLETGEQVGGAVECDPPPGGLLAKVVVEGDVLFVSGEFVSCGPAPGNDATQLPRDRLVAIDAETMTVLDLPLLTNGRASALDVSATHVLQNTWSWWFSPNFTLYRR
jgi:hypothetical protein